MSSAAGAGDERQQAIIKYKKKFLEHKELEARVKKCRWRFLF